MIISAKISYLYQVITILVRMELKDTYVHKGLRMQLVQQLKDKGVDDKKVLSAIAQIPRHLFMDEVFLKYAYQDKAFPIGCDQTISQPLTVAIQTALLNVKPHEKNFRSRHWLWLSNSCFTGFKRTSLQHRKAKRIVFKN